MRTYVGAPAAPRPRCVCPWPDFGVSVAAGCAADVIGILRGQPRAVRRSGEAGDGAVPAAARSRSVPSPKLAAGFLETACRERIVR